VTEAIRIGVIGLGRSGWQNHCRQIATLPAMWTLAAAADADPARQQQAVSEFGARAYASPEALLADPGLEVVTIATPSHLHHTHVLAALRAGKHVVCEKPMAGSLREVDEMIAAAEDAGRILTVFQNRRFSPDFLKVQEVLASGILGRIVQIRIASHTYKRRWDWQTLKRFHGGELNNTASHCIDQAVLMLDEDHPEITGMLDRTLTCGDAEDYTNLVLRAPGKPWVQVESSNAAAIEQERWHIMGTRGALAGSGTKLRWRVSNVDQLPPREADPLPSPDRTYGREKYEFQEFSWECPKDSPPESIGFYTSLYRTLREGKPLAVTPQSVRRQIDVLDRCRASAAALQEGVNHAG
jgi:scyllo-inositol 2-dehydrogenase (NADP+)